MGENGILSCGATINGNFDVDVVGDLPTACPSEYLITVTNMDISDTKVTNAGYGAETIDLGAHGAGAYNTQNGNGYGGFGGTSGATPHVTGAIALLYSAPCQDLADLAMSDPARAARIVRDFIFSGVDPNPSLEGITTTEGRLNLHNSLVDLMNNCENLAVSEFDDVQPFVVYPNPTNGLLTIEHKANQAIHALSIYTLDGRLIKTITDASSNTISVDFLSKGAYMLQVQFIDQPETPFTKMIIKE